MRADSAPPSDSVDIEALSSLHAQIPPGPYSADRRGDGYEVRAFDTRPDDKHHWPYRLLASIPGQQAACDNAVFAFVAGVVNAWPEIATALNSGTAGVPAGHIAEGMGDIRAVCDALGFDPTNHHNAAKCPYCTPTAGSARTGEVERLVAALTDARKTVRSAWGAISSGQSVDKQVEKTLRQLQERIDATLRSRARDEADRRVAVPETRS